MISEGAAPQRESRGRWPQRREGVRGWKRKGQGYALVSTPASHPQGSSDGHCEPSQASQAFKHPRALKSPLPGRLLRLPRLAMGSSEQSTCQAVLSIPPSRPPGLH